MAKTVFKLRTGVVGGIWWVVLSIPPGTYHLSATRDWALACALAEPTTDRLGLELMRETRPFVPRPRRLIGWLFPGEN